MKQLIFLLSFISLIIGCSTEKTMVSVNEVSQVILNNPPSSGRIRVFYIDPQVGHIDNDGSESSPWDTLENVLKQGYVKTHDYNGKRVNKKGVIKAGDVVKLRTGNHGNVDYKNSYNYIPIIFEAEQGHRPELSRLVVNSAENLVFKGLTISPSIDTNGIKRGDIVSFCKKTILGKCNKITLQDSFIYSEIDVLDWTRDRWISNAFTGVSIGKGSTNIHVINNYILNVKSGLVVSSEGSLVAGNTISHYYKDGLRFNANNGTIINNIVKNSMGIEAGTTYAIRGYNGSAGIKNMIIKDNILIGKDEKVAFSNKGSGIVFFDGPIDSFIIDGNVVGVTDGKGVSLYDSIFSEITNNVVFNPTEEGGTPKIMLGSKKISPHDNIVESNKANRYYLTLDKTVNDTGNSDVSETDYWDSVLITYKNIIAQFGEIHSQSNRPRIDRGYLANGMSLASEDIVEVVVEEVVVREGVEVVVVVEEVVEVIEVEPATNDPIIVPNEGDSSVFYIDPVNGSINNTGSSDSPWNTLEMVLSKGYIETKDKNGNIRNEGAPVKAGDTIKLRSGYHGSIVYQNSYNDELITIEAEDGETPELSRLEVNSAKNILFKGLTISPSFNQGVGGLVKLCKITNLGTCDNITIMNSYLYTVKDSNSWVETDWVHASTGVYLGKGSTNFKIINNMISNVSMGIIIHAPNSLISGNVINNYSKDGIRISTNHTRIEFNIIKNNYDVDGNHDDAIQGYGANGEGDVLTKNIIIAEEDPSLTFPGPLQGIAYFDGPLSNVSIIGNAVDVQHWHGISLYDSTASLIAENVVYTSKPIGDMRSRILISTKSGNGGSKDNSVISNRAHSISFSADKTVTDQDNSIVSQSDYVKKFSSVMAEINARYGDLVSKHNFPRVSSAYINNLGIIAPEDVEVVVAPEDVGVVVVPEEVIVVPEVVVVPDPTSLSVFYIDPVNGSINNTGSSDSPWNTLEMVLSKGYIETKDKNGNIRNEGAPVKAGDTIKLRSGYHGSIVYQNSYNDELITIEAEDGETPELSRLEVNSAKNILFKGLTISPSFNQGVGGLVKLCKITNLGTCDNITIMNSYLYTVKDSNSWVETDWVHASTGVYLGKGSTNFKIINNMISNVSMGIIIHAPNSLISGNVINNYSKDGIRISTNHTRIEFNIIKNNYDVDGNHDDAIQGYGANGEGDVLTKNIIIAEEDPSLTFPGPLQGIAYFDGPLSNVSIIGNAVDVQHWHGISLYDSTASLIAENVVYTSKPIGDMRSRILISTKSGNGGSKDNSVISNRAHSISFSADKTVTDQDNSIVSQSDYVKKFSSVMAEINARYGDLVSKHNFPRVSSAYINNLGIIAPEDVEVVVTPEDVEVVVAPEDVEVVVAPEDVGVVVVPEEVIVVPEVVVVPDPTSLSVFYIDPVNGSINNTGSSDSPWNTLEMVLSKGYIETKDKNGNIRNEGAPVKAGDTIKLRSGYHGSIVYQNSYNDELITIEAEDGETPELSRLEVNSAKNILFKGLTISPSFNQGVGGLVKLCKITNLGTCDNITIMNSYLYTVKDSNSWVETDWVHASTGVYLGKGSTNFKIINNMISNVSMGIIIHAPNSLISGNVINNYSKDGIRISTNHTRIEFNIIKNNYDVDGNHDDAIQGYGANGEGDVLTKNIIIAEEDPSLTFPGPLQGIAYFDGPLSNVSIIGNAVDVQHWHGISLYDSTASLIAENVVYTSKPIGDMRSRILISTKSGNGGSKDNSVISNRAHSISFSADKTVTDQDNSIVSQSDYVKKFSSVMAEINARYGDLVSKHNFPRVSSVYKNRLGIVD